MQELEIFSTLVDVHDVPETATMEFTGERWEQRPVNKFANTFSKTAATYFREGKATTYRQFKRHMVRRRLYGITPLMWVVWAFRLASWAKTIWDLWQSRAGNDSN